MDRHFVFGGFALLFTAGCATLSGTVADRAQQDLACGDVDVSEQGGGEYVASGCGGSASYTCMYGDTSEIDTGFKQPVCIREGNLDVPRAVVQTSPSPAKTAPPPTQPTHFPLVTAIATMKLAASFAEDCNTTPGPRGTGMADVVFATDGHPTSVTLSAPFQGTAVGECVAGKFRRVVLPAFSHGPKSTHKAFTVPALPDEPPIDAHAVAPERDGR
jgi:hypothetical protein